MQNFYSVLQVARKASEAEIKAAFRNVAKTCHPDVKPGDPEAEKAFQEAKRAYKFLSNPETRKIYDDFLAHRQAAARQRLRRAAATMSATFLLTAASVVLVVLWLSDGGLPLSSRLRAETPETTGALEVARRADPAAHQVEAAGATPARP